MQEISALETPKGPRYVSEPTPDGMKVVIPAARSWPAILFLMIWMAGWLFAEVTVVGQLAGFHVHGTVMRSHGSLAFIAVWLLGWTLGGMAVLVTLVWQFAGREVISANPQRLSRRVEVFGLGRTRSYATSDVKDLRATAYINDRFAQHRALFHWTGSTGYGALAFDYGARTIRMAPGMDEAEAKMLVAELSRRL